MPGSGYCLLNNFYQLIWFSKCDAMTIESLYHMQQFMRSLVLMLLAIGLQLVHRSPENASGKTPGARNIAPQPRFVELVFSLLGFRFQLRICRLAAPHPSRLIVRQARLGNRYSPGATPIPGDPRAIGGRVTAESMHFPPELRLPASPGGKYKNSLESWPWPASRGMITAAIPYFRPEGQSFTTLSAGQSDPAGALPRFKGLDIAARSVACDDTGGDFYFLRPETRARNNVVRVAVGDAADHGRKSTALMLAAQSTLHERSRRGGNLAAIVSDVNDRLTSSGGDDGEFTTLYFMDVDPDNRCLNWVRAGHDPAVLYDPATDTFQSLKGAGIPLGVEADWHYKENLKTDLAPGQIITIATDGICEAHNREGRMLGKQEVQDCIRTHAALPAEEILDAVFARLGRFTRGTTVEDDATLVVIKVME